MNLALLSITSFSGRAHGTMPQWEEVIDSLLR
jgi:hypothetical protein